MGYFINACRTALRNAKAENDEWFFNENMVNLRAYWETIDEYLGGESWEGFKWGYFPQALRSGGEGWASKNPPSVDDVYLIRDAWFDGGLYRKVLSGDADVLNEVGINAVAFLVQVTRVCFDNDTGVSFRHGSHLESVVNEKIKRWPGYKYDDASWAEDWLSA